MESITKCEKTGDKMATTITLKDVINFIELNKSRAELTFQLEIIKNEKDEQRIGECEAKLQSVISQVTKLGSQLEQNRVGIAYPNENEILRLNAELAASNAMMIHDAMKKKTGPVYETLLARGSLIKKNFENRENIAKLALLIAKLPKDVAEAVAFAIRNNEIAIPILLLNSEQETVKKIVKVLGRIGMLAAIESNTIIAGKGVEEISVQLPNKKVWVTPETSEKLSALLLKIKEISPRIQLKNAVRQIKTFDETEEKEFAAIQNEYLLLLKEQDELLKEFDEESMLNVQS
jgi:hypothetical protein